MPDSAATPVKTFDDRLKTAGLVLGLASTALGVFVAVKAQLISSATSAIDVQVKKTQEDTARIDKQLREQEMQKRVYETSVRLVAKWDVMNANELARGLDEGSLKFAWVDEKLQQQLTEAAKEWKKHNRLMSRGPDQGLLLRQVICLRLLNIGASPARKLRLMAAVHEFDSTGGSQGGLYTELLKRTEGAASTELKLGDLMEAGQEARRLTTEIVIPVGQAVGSQRYVGRIFVPVKVLWHDERQDKEGSLKIEVEDPLLANRLRGGDLGRSVGGG